MRKRLILNASSFATAAWLTLTLTLTGNRAFCANTKADTLNYIAQELPKMREHVYHDPALSIRHLRKLTSYSHAIGTHRNSALLLATMGQAYLELRLTDTAYKHFVISKKLSESYKNDSALAVSCWGLAKCHLEFFQLDSAAEYFVQALKAAGKAGHSEMISRVQMQSAELRFRHGDYHEALAVLNQAAKSCNPITSKLDFIVYWQLTADVHLALQDYSTAEQDYLRAGEIIHDINSPFQQAKNVMKMSAVFKARNDYDAAIQRLNEAEALFDTYAETTQLRAVVQHNTADVVVERADLNGVDKNVSDYHTAMRGYQEALVLFQQSGSERCAMICTYNMARCVIRCFDAQNRRGAWSMDDSLDIDGVSFQLGHAVDQILRIVQALDGDERELLSEAFQELITAYDITGEIAKENIAKDTYSVVAINARSQKYALKGAVDRFITDLDKADGDELSNQWYQNLKFWGLVGIPSVLLILLLTPWLPGKWITDGLVLVFIVLVFEWIKFLLEHNLSNRLERDTWPWLAALTLYSIAVLVLHRLLTRGYERFRSAVRDFIVYRSAHRTT